ncbi:hypothetical protein UFOVP87_13 [uncultured Caudovirales phage]|uniref:Major capsid protein Gp5 n=1 Tax=uncultured Caudovirales phage TaxID=2100421 RepID=A0A6J5KZS5_9CAUD|nr:hypothetical protein UFOVP87_13 [uncultured Caudovirales phage]
MALQTEIWVTDIQENLFPANDFMSRCKDHSAFINHLTVHLPQSGANPAIFKNNTSLPVNINQRNDTDFTYSLNNYKGEPLLITNLEELQNSYDKRSSVLGNVTRNMNYAIGNQTLYAWAPSGASRIVRTSGSAVATALAPSATGNRNAITLADIAALKAKLDNDNVPAEGRILLMPADMYNNQLLAISNIQAFYAYNLPTLQNGKVPTLFGFEVMVRPTVCVYDTSAVIKAISDNGVPSSPATTDNLACLAYHPDFVSKALGNINVYAQENLPQYYGSIMSIEVQHGASPLRSTSVGIAALIQQ